MKKSISFLPLLWSLWFANAVAQALPHDNALYATIAAHLVQRLGAVYTVDAVYDVDSLSGKTFQYPAIGSFMNPSGNLSHDYVFTATKAVEETGYSSRSLVGVFGNGSILGISDTCILGEYGSEQNWVEVLCVCDMNRDNNAEVIACLRNELANGDDLAWVWVFKWQAGNMELITARDTAGQSVIGPLTSSDMLTLADVNGDGIFELRRTWSDDGDMTLNAITWGWNGSLYGKWPETPQPAALDFLPRNALSVFVHCRTSKADSSRLIYKYSVLNSPQSLQPMNQFAVLWYSSDDSIATSAGSAGWTTGNPGSLVNFADLENPDISHSHHFLLPSQQDSSFITISPGLPAIRPYYARGFNFEPPTRLVPFDEHYQNLFVNSAFGVTVGAWLPAASPEPLVLIDSLTAFVSRSRSLSWIWTQPIADKYTGLISRMRNDLLQSNLILARNRMDTVLQQADLDSTSSLTAEAYALIRFNTEHLRKVLLPGHDVKGGIYTPSSFGSLTVKAKPDTTFTSGDSLIGLTATVRWPSQYNITFGTIATGYGFVKLDSAVTMGGYKYQKFRTTAHTPLAWQAGQEYELFSVPVTGACGLETFELTNALSGGEWFVDVNYLDKSDTSFYQRSVQGFAYQNKTAESYGTFANGQRHLIKGGGKLHETFASAGEILYRRSSDGGSSWEVTTRISDGRGACLEPSIASGASNMLYIVWEQGGGSSASLLFARSTDNGSTWSVADTLPGCTNLPVSTSQAGWLRPVIAELPGTPAQVIIVWADQGGLKYLKSTNGGASWVSGPTAIPPTLKSTTDNPSIWYPSLSSAGTYLMLTYDYRAGQPELYSRVYTASSGWSSEACVTTSTGTVYDRHSSNAILDDNTPFAVWCAQKYVNGVLDVDYRLMFRTGTSANTWSSTFVEFPKNAGIWDLYPTASTLSGPYSLVRGYRIIYQRTNSEVCTYAKPAASGTWTRARLSTNGQGVSATLEKGTNTGPTFLWTDFSASPYAISVGTSLGTPLPLVQSMGENQGRTTQSNVLATGEETLITYRKVVLEDPVNHSVLSFELGPIKLISADGDTTELPFKAADSTGTLTLQNVWDYLGTEAVDIGSGVRSVLVDVKAQNEVSADTSGSTGLMKMGANSFASASRAYRLELAGSEKGAVPITVYMDNAGASQRSLVTLSTQAKGKHAAFRLVGTNPASADLSKRLIVGLGDVLYRK